MPREGVLPFTMVDVFGLDHGSGNPLAVVHDADDLSADSMQAIARWVNLSETVFLTRPTEGSADYAVRIFALDRELPFAGHPSLGACHAWLDVCARPRAGQTIVQQCAAGLISIIAHPATLELVSLPLLRLEPPSSEELARALDLMGSTGEGLLDAMWVDNGPGWLGLLFDRVDTVLALSPRPRWPDTLHIGALARYPTASDVVVETRAFHTDHRLNVVEDPVTGSFNAAVAEWLIASGRLPERYAVSQGQCIGRRGRIDVAWRDDAIRIAGPTRTIVRGTIRVV